MDDWREYTSRLPTGLSLEEADLERSAEALIAKLEGFSERATGGNLSSSSISSSSGSEQPAPQQQQQQRMIPPPTARRPTPAAPSRRASIGSDADSETYGQSSQVSETSSTSSRSSRAAAHRKEQARRQQKLMQNRGVLDENCTGKPNINDRSAALAGKRTGDVGDRLLAAGKEQAMRKQAAIDEASKRAAEETLAARDMVPEINVVSHMLTSHREGDVADRLFSHAKDVEKRQAEKALEERRKASAIAKPTVSSGSEELVARMPGREGPIQDRLYADHEERVMKMHMKSTVALNAEAGEGRPNICETSRRLAEKANAGVPLCDRLANKTGSCPSRPAAAPTELTECVHAPQINQRSERLAMQAQARAWANGQINVEDRLIAQAPVHREEVVEDQKPQINPNSERILARRGPALPLEERLQQSTGVRRGQVGSEVDNLTMAPSLSVGTERMLAKKGARPSFLERQEAWAKKHARGEGNADLADMKYRFDKPEVNEPVDGVRSDAAPSGRAASTVSSKATIGPSPLPTAGGSGAGRKAVRMDGGAGEEDGEGSGEGAPTSSEHSAMEDESWPTAYGRHGANGAGGGKANPPASRPPLMRERDRTVRGGGASTPRAGGGVAAHSRMTTSSGPGANGARRTSMVPAAGTTAGKRAPPPQAPPPPLATPDDEVDDEAARPPLEDHEAGMAGQVLRGSSANVGTPGASRAPAQGRLGLGGVRSGLLAPGSPAIRKLLHKGGGSGGGTPSNESSSAVDVGLPAPATLGAGSTTVGTPGAAGSSGLRRPQHHPTGPNSGGSQLRRPAPKTGLGGVASAGGTAGRFGPNNGRNGRPQLPAQARGTACNKLVDATRGMPPADELDGYVDGYEGANAPIDELDSSVGGGDAFGEPIPYDEYDELLEAQEVERAAQRARALAEEDEDAGGIGSYDGLADGVEGAEEAPVDEDEDEDARAEREAEEEARREAEEEAAAHRERRRMEAAVRAKAEEAAHAEAEAAAAWAEAESSLFGGSAAPTIKAPAAFVPDRDLDASVEEGEGARSNNNHGVRRGGSAATTTTPAPSRSKSGQPKSSHGSHGSAGRGSAPRSTGSRRRSAGFEMVDDPADRADLDRATAEFEQIITQTNASPPAAPKPFAAADEGGADGHSSSRGGGGGLAELLAEAEQEFSHAAAAAVGGGTDALSPERSGGEAADSDASSSRGATHGVANALTQQLSSWCDDFERQMGLAPPSAASSHPGDQARQAAENVASEAARVDSLLLSPRAAREAARQQQRPSSSSANAAEHPWFNLPSAAEEAPAANAGAPPASSRSSALPSAPARSSAPPLERKMSYRRPSTTQQQQQQQQPTDTAKAKAKAEEIRARTSKQVKEAAAAQVAKAAAEARAAQEEAEAAVEGATSVAASAQREVAAAAEEIAHLKRRLEETEEALSRARGVAREVSSELDAMRHSVRSQGEAQRLSEAQCATLRRDLEEASEEHERERKELSEQLEHEKARREKEVSRLTSASEREKARLQEELDDVREQLARRDAQREEESTGLARKLEKELHAKQAQMSAELLTAQQALSNAKRQHALEIDEIASARDEAVARVARVEERATAAEEARRQAEAKLEELRAHSAATAPPAARSAAPSRQPLREMEIVAPPPQPRASEPEPREMKPKQTAAVAEAPPQPSAAAAAAAGGAGMSDVERELLKVKEALRKSEEEQLGAALRARRKEKELKEQLRKQALMGGETRC